MSKVKLLNEKQGKFNLGFNNKVLSCEKDNFVNMNVASKEKNIWRCPFNAETIRIGKCGVFYVDKKCEDVRIAYKASQNYLPLIEKITGKKFQGKYTFDSVRELQFALRDKNVVDGATLLRLLHSIFCEASFRHQHRQSCVCVADEDHLTRLQELNRLCEKIAEKIESIVPVQPPVLNLSVIIPWASATIAFTASQLGAMLKICDAGNIARKITEPVINAVSTLSWTVWSSSTNRKLMRDGKLAFDGMESWGWLSTEWDENDGLEELSVTVKEKIRRFFIGVDIYAEGKNCVVIKDGKTIDVKFNTKKLAAFIKKQLNIEVDEAWLDANVQTTNNYKQCLDNLIRFQVDLMEQLFERRTKLNAKIFMLIQSWCDTNGGGGNSGKILPGTVKFLSVWHKIQQIYPEIKVSGDIGADLKKLSLEQADTLAELLEETTKKRKFATR